MPTTDLLSNLCRCCNELHSLPSAEDIPKGAVVMVADLAMVPYAEVWFLDREAEVVRLAAVNDEAYLSDDLLRVLPLDESVVGEIVTTATVKIHPDLREVPYWRRGKWSEEKGLTQYIGVPLFFEDRVVGAFSILAESHHHLGPAEVQILQLFADQTATATLRKQAEEELQEHRDHLKELVEERTAELKAANEELLREITEHKRAEEAVGESEARVQAIVETVVSGIVTIDERGTIESVNPAAERTFGYGAGELVGKNVKELMPSPYREEHDGHLANYLATGEAKIIGFGRETVGQRRDGSIFPVDLAVSEVRVGDRRLFTGIVSDLTERKQMEHELVRAEKLASLGVLSGGASHEILNPLNIIKLKLHMLLEDKALGPEQRQEAREMMDEVDRISEVVKGLAVFTRRMKAERQPVAIQEELARAAQRIKDEARQLGIEVVEDYLPASPMVMGNPALLHQALDHILGNAVEAMPDGGTLTLLVEETTRRGAPQVNIGITDTGVGISQEHLSKVFDPFFTTRDVGEGKGLGLSIAHGIVEHLGGTISVESAEGRGTTFIIQLPVKPD